MALDLLAYVAREWRQNRREAVFLTQAADYCKFEAFLANRPPVEEEDAAAKQWPGTFNAQELQIVSAYN